MEVFGGMLVAAFLLFIATKMGFATVKFHKRPEKPTSTGSGSGGGGSSRVDKEILHK